MRPLANVNRMTKEVVQDEETKGTRSRNQKVCSKDRKPTVKVSAEP